MKAPLFSRDGQSLGWPHALVFLVAAASSLSVGAFRLDGLVIALVAILNFSLIFAVRQHVRTKAARRAV